MQKIKNHLEKLGYTVTTYGKFLHATSKSRELDKYITIEKRENYIISFAEALEGIVRSRHYEVKDYKAVINSIKG